MNANDPEAWMAMLHVRPLPGWTAGSTEMRARMLGVLALAANEQQYREMVAAEMDDLGLFIAETDHLRRFSEPDGGDTTLAECAANLSAEWPVQYHTFDCYPHDEA